MHSHAKVFPSIPSKEDANIEQLNSHTPECPKPLPYLMVTEKIGTGCVGTVWAGFFKGKKVAFKYLHHHHRHNSKKVENFHAEVSLLTRLNHLNIIKVESSFAAPIYAMVMEFHPKTLFSYIDDTHSNEKRFIEYATICYGIAQALDYLHKNDILHRDIKPDNIVLGADFTPKLIDFDVAVQSDKDVLEAEFLVGTLVYLAPETLTQKHYSKKTDVYSFGVTVWEMWSGKSPYYELEESTSCEKTQKLLVMEAITKGQKNKLPQNMPLGFAHLINYCCEDQPDKRPTADWLADTLGRMSKKRM